MSRSRGTPGATPDRGVALRRVAESEWRAAMSLAARGFLDAPYNVAMLGPDPVARLAALEHLHGSSPYPRDGVALAAFDGESLVGLTVVSAVDGCDLCAHTDPAHPPEDPVLAREWAYEVAAVAVHARVGRHAHLARAVVDPGRQGEGIGSALVAAALAEFDRGGGGAVVLQCVAERRAFYQRLGFAPFSTFDDPYGPPAWCLRRAG